MWKGDAVLRIEGIHGLVDFVGDAHARFWGFPHRGRFGAGWM